MNGTGDGFSPNNNINRAQLVTVLYRMAGQPEVTGENPFTDVAGGTWYADAVAWAAQNGIVDGVTATTFAPNDPVTREQMATWRLKEDKAARGARNPAPHGLLLLWKRAHGDCKLLLRAVQVLPGLLQAPLHAGGLDLEGSAVFSPVHGQVEAVPVVEGLGLGGKADLLPTDDVSLQLVPADLVVQDCRVEAYRVNSLRGIRIIQFQQTTAPTATARPPTSAILQPFFISLYPPMCWIFCPDCSSRKRRNSGRLPPDREDFSKARAWFLPMTKTRCAPVSARARILSYCHFASAPRKVTT